MSVLAVRDLRRAYDNLLAVDGVSFSIEAGEVFGLLGPNGAGKSTTINVVAGILQPDGGSITINDRITQDSRDYRYRIGYVPQEISLAERLTARENLELIGRLYDLHGASLDKRVDELLEAVDLRDRASDLVIGFSGGMKRRLNVASAMLHRPDVLLMDEPTAGVDAHARAYLFDIVERIASQGRAILYTTHYMEEAQRLCRRTAIIDHGKILATGTMAELVERVNAKRDLVLEADDLSPERISDLADRLGGVPWTIDDGRAHLNIAETRHTLLDAVRAADETGLSATAIGIHEPNLESVFLELTGRALRD